LPAIANEHNKSGFKVFHLVGVELHFVWLLSADFSLAWVLANPTGYFLFPASTVLQVMEAHKRFHHGKALVRRNQINCLKQILFFAVNFLKNSQKKNMIF